MMRTTAPRRLYLTGLTSARLGSMEYHNLGNYTILEPLIEGLKRQFPSARIYTSLQLTESFCARYEITCIRDIRLYSHGRRSLALHVLDLVRAIVWWAGGQMGFRAERLVKGSVLLSQLRAADLVVDFSGDLFGDNSSWSSYLDASARLLAAKVLGKPVCMIAGSPGPFGRSWRRAVARVVLPALDLVTNREPASTELLSDAGLQSQRIVTTACPSVLFTPPTDIRDVLEVEGLTSKPRPIAGLIITGWNFVNGPANRWPRDEYEFEPFIKLIEFLVRELELSVCVMSHQNATTGGLELIRGGDHRIVERLLALMESRHSSDDLFTLRHCYDASTMKAIIGCCDILVSGRVHGAVQGLSQLIPTAIIGYGHPPPSHKIAGFARVYGVEQYVADPRSAGAMIDTVQRLWADRDLIRVRLATRVPQVASAAERNFELLGSVYRSLSHKNAAVHASRQVIVSP